MRSEKEGSEMSSKSTTNLTPSCSRNSSTRSKHGDRVVTQTPIDAKLQLEFEESEKRFDYSTSVTQSTTSSYIPSASVSAYLQKMQRGSLIQPFGCLIAIDPESFKVLAFSENVPEMLELAPHAVPSIEQKEGLTFGTDVRNLFRSSGVAALQKAASFGSEISMLNPILVHSKISGKPFYAILYHIDVGIAIDLEPVNPEDVLVTATGALKSYKLAARAISKLQSLSSGNIALLCDILAREVGSLTGYDRVMVYKFHEDEHGEVIAECHKPGLEPYMGLHYPATDIPQASRFLFMKNKVRMICDCLAKPLKVLQDKGLAEPLSLAGSTLRAPHGCHSQYMVNMGSIASLVMSVTINEGDDETDSIQQNRKKLWGLVVCHHTTPRFVPFPLRYACEFLIQIFSVQINKEVELAAQVREKHMLRTQTVLCDMLLRDAPLGIVTQSPNVMDLVKCDGAALYYQKKCWLLGVTPTEGQITDIVEWLMECHSDSTGLSTDSLMEAGYPYASILGDAVCGMAAIRITANDFLFWFRSHTAKEIKWGGAKHDPGEKDDARKMHPRSSFKAFLEVVKKRSVQWEDVEMDAIHSLQIILRDSLQNQSADGSKMIVNVPTVGTSNLKRDELCIVTNEMVRLIETASIPIFSVDTSGLINGWNNNLSDVTGLSVQEAIGMPFIDLLADDSEMKVTKVLSLALRGEEKNNVEIKLKTYGLLEKDGPVTLIANACCNRDLEKNIVGVCFVGQNVTGQKLLMDKFARIHGDYVGIIMNPRSLLPPIFMMDEYGRCLEWNESMKNLTGVAREEAIDHMLLGEVFTVNKFGCRLKDEDMLTKLKILLNGVVAGQEADKLLIGFYNQLGKYVEALVLANKRTDTEGRVTGVLCFLHVTSPELQYAMQVQKISVQAAESSTTKLTYLRREIRNPINGIKFVQNLMTSSDVSNKQSQLLKISTLCQEQLAEVIDNTDIGSIEECYLDMSTRKFNLGESLEAVVNQVTILSRERHVQVVFDSPGEVSSMYLYGDTLKLQQVLSDFLATALLFTPTFQESSVLFKINPRKKRIGSDIHVVRIEFRITHPAPGIPEELIQEMFYDRQKISKEGLVLHLSLKLVKMMNGTVQYLRDAERSSFIILVEFPLVHRSSTGSLPRSAID
ncbi:hypothetical protein Leryth_001773 [Lithospermum erythrorhizon]|nr:hypothetical protein Leryth_001773 [Lithospermum erythrorhizon]